VATCAYVSTLMRRLQQKGIKAVLLSGDREEAVATIAKTVGMGSDCINASLTPQHKSEVISTLKSAGHRVAMVTIFNLIHYFSRIYMSIENSQWSNRSFMLVILIFSINCLH
jgi:deoxyribodipyrimidine photolyase